MPAGQKKIGWLDSLLSKKPNDKKNCLIVSIICFGHRFALISKTPPDQKLKAGWTAFNEIENVRYYRIFQDGKS